MGRRFPCRRRRRKAPRPRPRQSRRELPRSQPIPSPRQRRQPRRSRSSPTPSRSRFRRRCRRARGSPTSSSVTPRTRWISGSSIWRGPIRFSSPAKEAGPSLPTTRAMSLVSRATTRENGRSSSRGPVARASGAPFTPGEFRPIAFSIWDGLSRERGNRRGLTVWYSLYVEPEEIPSAVGPMVRTALIILAIELAVIGLVRRRYGSRAQSTRTDERVSSR